MTVEDFLQGEGKRRANALAADEVLTEVTFPVPDAFTASAFVKHGKRKSLAISDIGAGVVLRFDESGMCTFASLRAGALARYPLRLNAAEDYLVGKHLDEVDIEALRSIFAAHEREATKNRAHKKYSMPGVFCHAVEAVMDRWNAMQEEHHD